MWVCTLTLAHTAAHGVSKQRKIPRCIWKISLSAPVNQVKITNNSPKGKNESHNFLE